MYFILWVLINYPFKFLIFSLASCHHRCLHFIMVGPFDGNSLKIFSIKWSLEPVQEVLITLQEPCEFIHNMFKLEITIASEVLPCSMTRLARCTIECESIVLALYYIYIPRKRFPSFLYCLLFSRESRTTSSLLETIQKRTETFPCFLDNNYW